MTFEEFKAKAKDKYYKVKADIQQKTTNALYWMERNPELAIVLIPLGAGVIKTGIGAIKSVNNRKTEELKDQYIYDRSLGTYIRLNRRPTTDEYLEIEARRRNGEPLTIVLRSMRLI